MEAQMVDGARAADGTKIFNFEDGVKAAIGMITEMGRSADRPVVICIAGGSASGKTAMAAAVGVKLMEELTALETDSYCRGAKALMEEQGVSVFSKINFDMPSSYDLARLREHVLALKEGKEVDRMVYDFATSTGSVSGTLKPGKFIIVEGLFALHDELRDLADIKIFIHADKETRERRRMRRDLEEQRARKEDIEAQLDMVEKMYVKNVLPTAGHADILVVNNWDGRKEGHLRTEESDMEVECPECGHRFRVPRDREG